ncbi:hypothetical protein NDU88_003352 [Pleurodeles waltl]|uniref:Uncharacterized protein n=1 Tax=Pleurodeles waltl TaxID=8319 RepID=A0AAV7NGK6_PLEWA|nr:hypothetical protein NDU88_003352 [Pleurodeles waltl]
METQSTRGFRVCYRPQPTCLVTQLCSSHSSGFLVLLLRLGRVTPSVRAHSWDRFAPSGALETSPSCLRGLDRIGARSALPRRPSSGWEGRPYYLLSPSGEKPLPLPDRERWSSSPLLRAGTASPAFGTASAVEPGRVPAGPLLSPPMLLQSRSHSFAATSAATGLLHPAHPF